MKPIWTSLFAATLAMASAKAGGVETHGGPAVVCRKAADPSVIESAEMLDLFEARNVHGLHVPLSRVGTAEEIAVQTRSRLRQLPTYQAAYDRELREILERRVLLEPGVQNLPTDDVFPIVERAGCRIEQVAVYLASERRVLIDREIFEAMDATNRAALFVHETVYKIDRDRTQAESAVRSRKLTAYLFSDPENLLEIARIARIGETIAYPLEGGYAGEGRSSLPTCVMAVKRLADGERIRVSTPAALAHYCSAEEKKCWGNYLYLAEGRWLPETQDPVGCALVHKNTPFYAPEQYLEFGGRRYLKTAF